MRVFLSIDHSGGSVILIVIPLNMGQFRLRNLFLLVAASAIVVVLYIQLFPAPPAKPPKYNRPVSRNEVLAISKWQIHCNEPWSAHNAEYEIQTADNGWFIIVWRLPKVPGGSRYIELNINGDLTSYHRH